MDLIIKLYILCGLTCLVLVSELVAYYFILHVITIQVVAWQAMYNFRCVVTSIISLKLTNADTKIEVMWKKV